MSAINEMGVNIVENDDRDDEEDERSRGRGGRVDPLDDGGPRPAVATKKEAVDRTDDPVRMYLREMGAVELLSREGEIAIAKRIEAGRDTMILGLCESPITFNAIIDWSNALNDGTMQLREILDLDAMLSKGPPPSRSNATRKTARTARSARRPPARPSRKRKRPRRPRRPQTRTTRTWSSAAPRARPRTRTRTTPSPSPRWKSAQADGAREVRRDHRALQEVRQAPGARIDALGRGEDFAPPTRRSTRSCASSSPPRSRASSSTPPRSNIWSTSSTPSTAA